MALLTVDVKPGYRLPEVACQFRLEHFKRGAQATIHTDPDAARREGLAEPVATGPQVAALIFRQLRDAYGRAWIEGSRCELTFRRPVRITDFCVAKGVVSKCEAEQGGTRVYCDVWIENGAGEKAIVGTASGVVTGDAAR